MKVYIVNQCTEWEGTDLLGVYSSMDKAKCEKLIFEANHKDELEYSWLEIREVFVDHPAQECDSIDRIGLEMAC